MSECDLYRKKNWTVIPGEEQEENRPELGIGNWKNSVSSACRKHPVSGTTVSSDAERG